MEYVYPDIEDKLITQYIKEFSNPDYWEQSEKNIFNKIINRIQKENSKLELLDLGCGMGRLFNVFIPFVSTITALEPDIFRYENAYIEAKKISPNKIKVINGTINEINNTQIPLVLCSHIFQHISDIEVENILKKLNKIVPSNGLLFITTTFTSNVSEKFNLAYLHNGKYTEKSMTEKEFNSNSLKNCLPSRSYTYLSIEKLLKKNSFIIEESYCYHFDYNLGKDLSAEDFDSQMNKENLLDTARDILYIAKKQ